MKEISDSDLFKLIKLSNEQAFHEFHRRFWHLLYTIAYKKIGDPDEVNDLLQDMFIELWEKREILTFNNAADSWIRNRLWYKIAIYFRYKGFKQKHQDNFLAFLKTEAENTPLVNSLEMKETDLFYEDILNTINSCVEDMPGKMKEIFLMSRTGDYSVKEIAGTLNISPKTVKTQLERATAKLRKAASVHNPTGIELLLLLWLINY